MCFFCNPLHFSCSLEMLLLMTSTTNDLLSPTEDGDIVPETEPIKDETIQKLRNWVDRPPPFDQKANTNPVYLFKPKFTFPILIEGLIYAVGKLKECEAEYYELATLVMEQYEESIEGWLAYYGIEEDPPRICLQLEIESPGWEIEIRNADLTAEEKSLLPRTIVAIARLAVKLKVANDDMRRIIGVMQEDVEIESLYKAR